MHCRHPPARSQTNVYNGLDDRVGVTSGSTTHAFVYDADGRVLGEYGSSAADVIAETVWLQPEVANDNEPFGGDDGVGGYAPLAVVTGSGASAALAWVHGNHLGVPVAYTDASGAAVAAPSYTLPGFPGQLKNLGDLYYNRHRDYDSSTGRYVQADPIGLAGGSNPYLYAEANPLRFADPDGLDAISLRFPGYPVGIGLGIRLPLGHGAVVSVNPETGETRYYEFGRYDGNKCGIVLRRFVPDLEMRNGRPTAKSLKTLLTYISQHYGRGGQVTGKYYPDSDYQSTIDYAEKYKKKHPCYSLWNNCKTFADDAATARK